MASKSPSPEISKLQKKYDAEPDSLIFARLADAYLSEDMTEQAIKIAEKGVEKHQDYISGLMVLGKCYEKNGEEDKALDIYIRVLEKDKENLLALQKVAKGAYKSGRYEKALDSYKRLLDLNPFDSSIQQIMIEIEDIIQKKNVRDQMRHQMETSEQHPEKAEEELIFIEEETGKTGDDLSLDLELPIEKTAQIEEIFKEEEEIQGTGLPGDSVMDQPNDEIILDLEVEMLEKELEDSIEKEVEANVRTDTPKQKDEKPQDTEDIRMGQTAVEDEALFKPEDNFEEVEEKEIKDNQEGIPLYKGEIESVTMAGIYEKQRNYEKALSIYEKLLPDHPELSEDVKRVQDLISQTQEKDVKEQNVINTETGESVSDSGDRAYEETEQEKIDQLPKEQDFFDISENEKEEVELETEKSTEDTESLIFSQVASETLEELKKIERHMAILVPEEEKGEKEDSEAEERQEFNYNQEGLEAFKKWLDQIE
ncbi:tetratricopeptide repeat protein [candidate division WOR-3 bacterium]|nr:tetratricopeptide repeat protein [candidate division WOR-3 bacterium]